MSSSPSPLKKVKAKLNQLQVPAIFSRKTSRSSAPSSVSSPRTSIAGIPCDTPGWVDDQLSQENLLFTHQTLFKVQPAVINSKPTSSHSSESNSPRLPANLEPKTSDKLTKGSGVAWKGLETALRLLERSADVFPPLKSAVSGLVALLDLGEAVTENDEGYENLATELTKMMELLNEYGPALAADGVSGSVARIVESINTESTHIRQQQGRNRLMRTISANQDQGDVIQRYRRIESLFRQLQSDITLRNRDGIEKLREAGLLKDMSPVYEALYNSDYSTTVKRGKCTPETREKVLEELKSWVGKPEGAKIYWMNGMAGSGKTTISYTLCEWLKKNNQLGGNYFCSRASDLCCNINKIVPTLAHQLSQYSHSFRSILCNILEEQPGACRLNVKLQFKNLIQEPLKVIKPAIPDGVVIVIDALDECNDDDAFRLFLDTLLQLAVNLPIKFLITSRPEPVICNRMLASQYSDSVLHLHDIEESIVGTDIRKYLTEALKSMSPVPSSHDVEQLVKSAGKLFIYAATTVRYICPGDPDVDCGTRLQTVLGMVSGSTDQYDDLNQLYTSILHAALYPPNKCRVESERNNILLVLKTAVCAGEPMTTKTLASLLNLKEEQVLFSLQPLQSVLHKREGVEELIAPFHSSFPDFLFDNCRSKGQFHCERTVHNEVLTNHCFDLMKKELRFNICNLESSFIFDKNIWNLQERIEHSISPALSYACRYWGKHLLQGSLSDTVHERLVDFLTNQLLFWMEVLNLKQCIKEGYILKEIGNWLDDMNLYPDTIEQLKDAHKFIFGLDDQSCLESTPHIYISKLAFCPRTSSVYNNYWQHTQGLINMEESVLGQWSKEAKIKSIAFSPNGTQFVSGYDDCTIRVFDTHKGNRIAGPFNGHKDWIRSVTFSPDGTQIASGSMDHTIQVWNAYNGNIVAGPFKGHTNSVSSVAFSPNGTQIASGSVDQTIRVWDAHNGNMIAGPFNGHTDSVFSVTFSPDGTRIASGSHDLTIRVWNVHNGNMVANPFIGHTNSILSVVFSADGTKVASGSNDHTIRVWDAQNGNIVTGPFIGHRGSIWSIAFSPDGTLIASGSTDNTIRVWDAHNGNIVAGPFIGHIGPVLSVIFSLDGTQITSGSNDDTIRVWDIHSGDMVVGSFTGHPDPVLSVAFSPNGTQIVSGSHDCTVRVWDAHSGNMVSNSFIGHTSSVLSVTFSPDGTQIASGSNDHTIRVWDAQNGNIVAGPFIGHRGSIWSVAFSPDGTQIASGSNDHTIQVWNVHNGNILVGPFTGHTNSVLSVVFSSDGTRIASGSSDDTIRVWDTHTGNMVAGPFVGHTDLVSSVAFSPNGTQIASGSSDHTIRVWDAENGNMVAGPFIGHRDSVWSVAFSADGTQIASGSNDCTIRLWDAHNGNTVAGPFTGHKDSIWSVAFSPNGTQIVSGSNDHTIRVWDVLARPSMEKKDDRFNSIALSHSLFPSHILSNLSAKQYMFQGTGWVTANNNLLFWIPAKFYPELLHAGNILAFSLRGVVSGIDCHNIFIGETWSQCYH